MNPPKFVYAEKRKNPSVAGTAILGGITRNQQIPPWEVPYCLNHRNLANNSLLFSPPLDH